VAVIGADLRAAFPAVQFAVEYLDGFATEPGYLHDWAVNPPYDRRGNPIPPPPVGRLDEIAQRPLLKLLAKDDGADVDEYLLRAEEVLADRGTVTHSSSFGLLEIAAPGVTKASGLAELAASHGIGADEVVAIGDMPNDVPMLVWAGTSYAVANAHASAKEAADAVVGSNEEDAVALVIERLLGEQALP
jgi:hydroxymethylpyrimidine pyrophosphatase-like HAD family hydrolase